MPLGDTHAPSIKDVRPEAYANGEVASAVDVEAQFKTAVARLKMHLLGWGAPFADIEDAAVREITAILGEHWRRRTEANGKSSVTDIPDLSR